MIYALMFLKNKLICFYIRKPHKLSTFCKLYILIQMHLKVLNIIINEFINIPNQTVNDFAWNIHKYLITWCHKPIEYVNTKSMQWRGWHAGNGILTCSGTKEMKKTETKHVLSRRTPKEAICYIFIVWSSIKVVVYQAVLMCTIEIYIDLYVHKTMHLS